MTIATKGGSLIVKDGKLAENCGCCATPGGICGCQSGVSFPSYFSVTFSDFTFNLASTISGSPPSTSLILKSYLEGLSPLIFPVSPGSSNASYRRFGCSDLKTSAECQPIPPGFSSQTSGTSEMGFVVGCSTATALSAWTNLSAPARSSVCWRITAIDSSFTTFLEILIAFTNDTAFSFGDICALSTAQTAVTVVPQISGGSISTFLGTSGYFGRYSGSGTVQFEPMYSPLP